MAIGIEAIGVYVPEDRDSNIGKKGQFNITADFLERKIGVFERRIKPSEMETSDMCVKSFQDLMRNSEIAAEQVDCLIVCTQNPDGSGIPHTSAIVHGKIGCRKDCAAFDIGLGCSGYVYSLSVITSFMSSNDMKNGLLFTADPYSKIIDSSDKNTALLFGDAATATLLSEKPVFYASKYLFGTIGTQNRALFCHDGKLNMNGREIFSFVMNAVVEQLMKLIEDLHIPLHEIDLFVFHQASKYVLDSLAMRLGISKDKMPSNLLNIGNTVSSSIPLLLMDLLKHSQIKNILISGFGVGLSYANTVLERRND